MKKCFQFVAVAVLVTAVALPTQAQEKKKKGKGKGNRQPQAVVQLLKSLENAEIQDEQRAKIKELVKKYVPQIRAVSKERTELLGQETQKKMNAARKEQSAAGKKGKELTEAVHKAAGLTDEQRQKLATLQKKTQGVVAALKKDVSALLTDEQKKAAGLNKGKRRKKKDS